MPPQHNEKAVTATKVEGKNEMLIDGRWYDVTSFTKWHPGGNIIKFMYGQDASEAFREFHNRSDRAKKKLNALPSRPAVSVESKKDPLVEDFLKLRKELENEGYFDPSPAHVAYRYVELIVIHLIGFYMFTHGWVYSGVFVFAIGNGRCGWVMHEAGHGSLTGVPKIDSFLNAMTFALGNGMSGAYWNNQHNKHHATPQKLKHDVDLNTLPLVAFNKFTAREAKDPISKAYLRLQAYIFAPVSTLMVTLGWAFFLHPRYMWRKKLWTELFFLMVRWVFVFSYFDFVMFMELALVGGTYIFLNFAVSHTHKPVLQPHEHTDWVRYSGLFTTNITDNIFVNWWMGYLNFQIEHHLFPSMPQFRQAQIAPRVRALFKKHNLEYDCCTYWDGLRRTFTNLNEVAAEIQ